eukprot:TRINITY_DN7309_c0_g1_i1.p1 TRINITY_DN7309_c0_g1~~TRINITY_DN7309_c0_g1_i1.p1  ORF type:complete len:174 (+),score=35.27 TRINITY_DN7309_c0_g1_i1:753-1274(+)
MADNKISHKLFPKSPYPFCHRVPSSPKERARLSGINPGLLLKIVICFVCGHPSPVLLVCSSGVVCDVGRVEVWKDGEGDICFDDEEKRFEKVCLEIGSAKKVKDWDNEFSKVYLKGYCPPFGPHWGVKTKFIMDKNLQNQRIAFFELDYAIYVQITIEELSKAIAPNKIIPFS